MGCSNQATGVNRMQSGAAVCMVALVLIIGSPVANAGLAASSISAAQVGTGLKKFMDRTTKRVDELLGDVIKGNDKAVLQKTDEILSNAPGELVRDSFFVLSAVDNIARRAKGAVTKVKTFAGDVKEGFDIKVANVRALAVSKDRRGDGWSEESSLRLSEPIRNVSGAIVRKKHSAVEIRQIESPAAKSTGHVRLGERKPSVSSASRNSWSFEDRVQAEHNARPHCYGIIDDKTAAECEREQNGGWGALAAESSEDRNDKGNRWADMRPSNTRYDQGSSIAEKTSGNSLGEYERALADNLGSHNVSTDTVEGGYKAVLGDLEAKKLARLEKTRQGRVAAERPNIEVEQAGIRETQQGFDSGSQDSTYDCESGDGGAQRDVELSMQAIKESEAKAKRLGGGIAIAHCARANIGRAAIWLMSQCLEKDQSMDSMQRRQYTETIEDYRKEVKISVDAYSTLVDGSDVCSCWSKYCAD